VDDCLIFCETKNQLRTVVKLMNQILEEVKQTKHPYKTFIGRIKKNGCISGILPYTLRVS